MIKSLVSIVLPIYNPDEGFLELALKSICEQSYKQIELIISDDSPVLLPKIKSLIKQYENSLDIKYYKSTNQQGIFSNLNNAVHFSNGDYVQIFSQDDMMMVGFIEDQVMAFERNSNIGMVFSAFKEINEKNIITSPRVKNKFNQGKDLFIPSDEARQYFLTYGCLPGNISPVMVHRKVFDEIGYFNEDLKFAGDYEFWVRISLNFNLYFNHKIGLVVRNHPSRASSIISNHQLLHDLTHVYKLILDQIPATHKRKALDQVNRVGATFVHHAIKNVILMNWPFSSLSVRYKELNLYPFNALYSTYFYIISFPRRIFRLIAS